MSETKNLKGQTLKSGIFIRKSRFLMFVTQIIYASRA